MTRWVDPADHACYFSGKILPPPTWRRIRRPSGEEYSGNRAVPLDLDIWFAGH
jgi:hypothetical protein